MAELKPVRWLGDSLGRLRETSEEIRSDAGYQLELVQRGEQATDFRPMPIVGPGAMEIRIHAGTEYRVFYVAHFREAVYVLHSFPKKTQKTPDNHIEIGRRRYRAMKEWRKDEGYEE